MSEHRSGFTCFIGRPNAGKSTLMNALVGKKVAITSDKPQTTRHTIRGIVHRPDAQLVIVDTPGLHKPRTLLGERLNDLVRSTWAEVDVIGFCLAADEKPGPGDRYILAELAGLKRPLVGIVTKLDLVQPDRVAQELMGLEKAARDVGVEFADLVPVSAVSSDNLQVLSDVLVSHLPPGPPLYPEGDITDEPEETLIAELIREAALDGVRDELPHSIAVTIEEMGMREGRRAEDPLLDIFAMIHVERDSQKGIVIGHKGERLKSVGIRSRKQIVALLGTPVHLDLRVRVAKDWQRDP
ncbi:MAG: GTPase Era, partial [Actinomycetes bacterium]